MNGGTCQDGVFQYTCACVDGYTGTHCETGKGEQIHVKHLLFLNTVFAHLAYCSYWVSFAYNLGLNDKLTKNQ